MSEEITIPRPHVPYGPAQTPELLADADYLDHAARNLEGGYAVGGYNVTATVIKLLHDTASALRAAHAGAADEFAPGECDGSVACTAPIHVHGYYTPHRSDQCDSPDEYGHTDRTNRSEETR